MRRGDRRWWWWRILRPLNWYRLLDWHRLRLVDDGFNRLVDGTGLSWLVNDGWVSGGGGRSVPSESCALVLVKPMDSSTTLDFGHHHGDNRVLGYRT